MAPKPDPRTIVVDAAMLDQLPSEVADALRVFVTQDEERRAQAARAADLAYQSELADTLVSSGRWVEVSAHPRPYEAIQHEYYDAVNAFPAALADRRRRVIDDDIPTVHQFYKDLYGIPSQHCEDGFPGILVRHGDRKHPYQLYDDYPSFIAAVEQEQSFIYAGAFWCPSSGWLTARRNAMTSLGGLCVDLDRVVDSTGSYFAASWVASTLLEVLKAHPELEPSYLLLSGTGIQLWYTFGQLIPLLSKDAPRRRKYEQLLKALYGHFDELLPSNRFKVDTPCASINHGFRAPGSPSKGHYPTRLYALHGRRRPRIDPLALSEALGCDLRPWDVGPWDQSAYDQQRPKRIDPAVAAATDRQVAYVERLISRGAVERPVDEALTMAAADELIKKGQAVLTLRSQHVATGGVVHTTAGHEVKRKPRAPGLYRYTLARIPEDTPVGSRYWALFALAGIAYNCGINRAELERDMTALLDTAWAQKRGSDGETLGKHDVKSAMRGYRDLGVLRDRGQIEALLQWSYAPPQKRNGRTRRDHLWGEWINDDGRREVNTAKANRELAWADAMDERRVSKIDALTVYLSEHPDASKRAAARDLHMSPPTVQKYWAEACSRAGIADTRSGNHAS